jgi:hypothetical protein
MCELLDAYSAAGKPCWRQASYVTTAAEFDRFSYRGPANARTPGEIKLTEGSNVTHLAVAVGFELAAIGFGHEVSELDWSAHTGL